MTNHRPTAIIFDWDNTLADTFHAIYTSHNAVRTGLGYTAWSYDETKANVRLAAKDIFPKWYGERAPEAHEIYLNTFKDIHLQSMKILDGVSDLLNFMASKNIATSVLSNKRGTFLRLEVAATGLEHHFKEIIGADDFEGPAKPNPTGLQMVMTRMGVEKGVWYMGDTDTDIKTAQAANVTPVYIENEAMCTHAEIDALAPTYRFKNPRECLAYLHTLG